MAQDNPQQGGRGGRQNPPREQATLTCVGAKAVVDAYQRKDMASLDAKNFRELALAKSHMEECPTCKNPSSPTPAADEKKEEKPEEKKESPVQKFFREFGRELKKQWK